MTKNREFNSRWGHVIADDYQYCHVPGYILRNYAKCISALDVTNDKGEIVVRRGQVVELDMQDMMFVIHVMAFKYDAPNGKATPGLPTIADYAGLSVNSIRRIKQRLMSYGLLTIESSPGRPDVYNFGGLHDQCARMEQELSPIEGVEIVTPHKNVRGNNFMGGSGHKNVRRTPDKNVSRRRKGISEGKNEKRTRKPKWANEDALIDVWASVRQIDAISMGADYHTDQDRRLAKKLLAWSKPITADEIRVAMQRTKHPAYPFSFLEKDVLAIRMEKPAAVHPSHVPFPAAETTPDDIAMPPEAAEALKLLTTQLTDEVTYAKSA